MKYLLLVSLEEPPEPPLETAEEIAGWDVEGVDIKPWLSEVDGSGIRLFGSQVSRPANASTVRAAPGDSRGRDECAKAWSCPTTPSPSWPDRA